MTEAANVAAAKPTEAQPKKASDDTGYVVLARQGDPSDAPWKVVAANLTARSAEHAVRLYAEKLQGTQTPRVLVAVPARSWRPVTVSAKVTTTLVIEGADS